MTEEVDIINLLVAEDETDLVRLRDIRSFRSHSPKIIQELFKDIFLSDSGFLNRTLKFFLAKNISELSGSQSTARFYASKYSESDIEPHWHVSLDYVVSLVTHPQKNNKEQIDKLTAQDWSESNIILLSQLVGFVVFQVRLVEGLRALLGINKNIREDNKSVSVFASQWNSAKYTETKKQGVTAFTQQVLGWEAWLPPRKIDDLSEKELAVLTKYSLVKKSSSYFLLLSYHLEILEKRTLIDRDIFYSRGGLERWLREFAAVISSKVNGCIYCASVHARKASTYAKEHASDVQKFIDIPAGQILATGFSNTLNNIIAFNSELAATPINICTNSISLLKEGGFSDIEIFDFIQSTAFFAWANRLMLSLGEPFYIEKEGDI